MKRHPGSSWRAPLALVLGLLLAGPTARGQTPSETAVETRARAHFNDGQEHFQAGRFREAIRAYQAGYDLSRRSGFLLNIGHAHRRLGDLESARLHYKKFLFVDPTSARRSEVEATIRQLDELREGSPPSPAPSPATLPGPVASSSMAPPPVAPLPAPVSEERAVLDPVTPGESPPIYRRLWFWSAIGVAVLGGTAAAYALGRRSDPRPIEPSLGTLRR